MHDGYDRFRHMKWKAPFENQVKTNPLQVIRDTISDDLPRFSLPIGEDRVSWTVWLSKDALWSRMNTLSQISVLDGNEREQVLKIFDEALAGDDVQRNEKGEIAMHGQTYFAWTSSL